MERCLFIASGVRRSVRDRLRAQRPRLVLFDNAVRRYLDAIDLTCALDRNLAIAHVDGDEFRLTLFRTTMAAGAWRDVAVDRARGDMNGFEATHHPLLRRVG